MKELTPYVSNNQKFNNNYDKISDFLQINYSHIYKLIKSDSFMHRLKNVSNIVDFENGIPYTYSITTLR